MPWPDFIGQTLWPSHADRALLHQRELISKVNAVQKEGALQAVHVLCASDCTWLWSLGSVVDHPSACHVDVQGLIPGLGMQENRPSASSLLPLPFSLFFPFPFCNHGSFGYSELALGTEDVF